MTFDKEIFLKVLHDQAMQGHLWADYSYRIVDIWNADQCWVFEF